MNRIIAIILMLVLAVASATAGIRHYCNYTIHTVLVTSSTSSSTSTAALITENKRDYYGEDLVYRNDTLEMVLTDVGYVDAQGRRHTQTTGALTTTYSHDVHGWLTKMENSRFSQELLYTTGATPCYNGNISAMLWRGADDITRRYDYSYDGMSRLTDATYSESGRIAIPGLTIQGTPDYSTSYSYDLNGNPTQIYRKGIAHKYASGSNRQWQYDEIDNLYIDYRGNQVNFPILLGI